MGLHELEGLHQTEGLLYTAAYRQVIHTHVLHHTVRINDEQTPKKNNACFIRMCLYC